MIRYGVRGSVLVLLLALSGCETMSSAGRSVTNLFGDDDIAADSPTVLSEDFESTLKVQEVWSKRIGKGAEKLYLKLRPLVIGRMLYVADAEGRLAATDLETGKISWEVHDKDVKYTGGPGGGDGLVLVGTGDARVIARESDSGRLRWVARVTSEVLSAPEAAEGVTVVRSGDGKVVGLDSETGAQLWSFDLSVPALTLRGNSAPVIVGDLVVVGFDNGRLAALELKTGRPRWDNPLAIPSGRSDLERMVDVDSDPVVFGPTAYVSSFHARIGAVTVENGQLEWTRDISSYRKVSVGDERVYVTDEEGTIWALERGSGNSLWKQDGLRYRFVTAPTFFAGYVIVGDFEGYVHWLDASTGRLVARTQIDDERIIAAPLDASDLVLNFSSSGRLVAMRPLR